MQITERNARILQSLHFNWVEKDQWFYRDRGLSGNNYMRVYYDSCSSEWVLYSWEETGEDEGWREDYENFDSLENLIDYFN